MSRFGHIEKQLEDRTMTRGAWGHLYANGRGFRRHDGWPDDSTFGGFAYSITRDCEPVGVDVLESKRIQRIEQAKRIHARKVIEHYGPFPGEDLELASIVRSYVKLRDEFWGKK